jgi:hypothetical protein
MRINIVDVSLAADQSGEPRVNLGDVTTGVGFAAGVATWGAGDGFVGIPNGPDGSNLAPQALMGTEGMLRLCLAVRDPRYVGKVGAIAEGDRVIVSGCDAGLKLTKASNKIGLLAVTQNMEISLDAANSLCTARVGTAQCQVSASLVSLSLGGLGAGGVSVSLSSSNIVFQVGPLVLTMVGNTVSIAMQTGPPAILTVNTVPVIVP